MSKRQAAKQLTHTNWDDADSDEEVGTFERASAADMGNRKIRTAKRRNVGGNVSAEKLFSGFGGFGKSGVVQSGSPAAQTATPTLPQRPSPSSFVTSTPLLPAPTTAKSAVGTASADLCAQLTALNEGVVAWCAENIKSDPYVDLTPVFDDYREHLANLREKLPSVGAAAAAANGRGDSAVKAADATTVVKAPPTAAAAQFSFTKTAPTASSTPLFSFAATSKPPDSAAAAAADDDADAPYEPPKVQEMAVEEADAFFSAKAKLFVLNDGKYTERGVGTVFLKRLDEGKTQLLMRAGTALGNIILNVAVTASVPVKRLEKNNVSIFCVPNPPVDPRKPTTAPTTLLLRLRHVEGADQLFNALT